MKSSGSPRPYTLVALILLGLPACEESDDPGELDMDGGSDGGLRDAAVPLDAAGDAKANPQDGSLDASLSCRLDQTYKYATIGGLVQVRERWELTATGDYRYYQTDQLGDAGTRGCMYVVPDCASAGVNLGTLRDAFAAPAVVAAFGDGSAVVGYDPRPHDGTVLSIERADGKKLLIGDANTPQGNSAAIPAAVEALRKQLNDLRQTTSTQTCGAIH